MRQGRIGSTLRRVDARRALDVTIVAIVGTGCAACAPLAEPSRTSKSTDAAAASMPPELAAVEPMVDEAWPGPTRAEPAGQPLLVGWEAAGERAGFTDSLGELGASAPPGVDLASIEMQRMSTTSDGTGVFFEFELAEGRRGPGPPDQVFAYGVVFDTDTDGVADYRIGMDNADGPRHREWIARLSTGEARINDGPTYGWSAFGHFTDTYYPGHEDPLTRGRIIASVGDPETRFYFWASVIAAGGPAITDFAPDEGWLTFQHTEGGASSEAHSDCGFPWGTALAFAGEASLAELRLEGFDNPEWHAIIGTVYVSDQAIDVPGQPHGRAWCLIPRDPAPFVSATGLVPDAWAPPPSP